MVYENVTSIAGWLDYLRKNTVPMTKFDVCTAILDNIDGYGTEYGYNEVADATDLSNAIDAMQIYLAGKPNDT